jgi:MYXO-CTERM domain-containing protein
MNATPLAITPLWKKTKTGWYAGIFSAAALLGLSCAHAAVIRQGPTYTPSGADFTISALQGIDSSNPLGQSGFAPQVNNNFEFTPSIGVSYDKGNGQLTDFGLGLYAGANNTTESTGLKITYGQAVTASSISITVEDFDIKSTANGFNPQKVSPGILLLGANGNTIANFTPSQILPVLSEQGKAGSDIWTVDFGQLLTNANIADTAASGFVLYADSANGEKPSSDPYLLLSLGNGNMTSVPEVSTVLPLLGVLGLAVVRRRRAATMEEAAA